MRALEDILVAVLEFLGFQVGKLALGELFPALILSSLVLVPIVAILTEVASDKAGCAWGGACYYVLGIAFVLLFWIMPTLLIFGWLSA